MGTPSMGAQSLLVVDPTSTLSGSSERYEFKSESVKKTGTIVNTNGIRGTRTDASERSRTGTYTVGGSVVMNVGQSVIRKFLPRIMGTAESGSGPYSYSLAETLPTFSAGISRIAKDFQYDGLTVNKANLRGTQGGLVELEMDWQGTVETVKAAATVSGYGISANTDSPFFFADAVFKIGGTSYPIYDFDLEIDNQLVLDRFTNSVYRTALPTQGRVITIKTNNPFTTSETGLYEAAIAGVSVVIVLTNGVKILTLTMAAVQYPPESPTVGDKGEIKLPLVGVARGVSTTKELTATLAVA